MNPSQGNLCDLKVAEQTDSSILKFSIEIDKYIAARDQLHLGEYRIGDQTVIRENNPITKRFIENRAAIVRAVVVGKGGFSSGFLVIFGERFDPVERVNSLLCSTECLRVDIGCIEQGPLF